MKQEESLRRNYSFCFIFIYQLNGVINKWTTFANHWFFLSHSIHEKNRQWNDKRIHTQSTDTYAHTQRQNVKFHRNVFFISLTIVVAFRCIVRDSRFSLCAILIRLFCKTEKIRKDLFSLSLLRSSLSLSVYLSRVFFLAYHFTIVW